METPKTEISAELTDPAVVALPVVKGRNSTVLTSTRVVLVAFDWISVAVIFSDLQEARFSENRTANNGRDVFIKVGFYKTGAAER